MLGCGLAQHLILQTQVDRLVNEVTLQREKNARSPSREVSLLFRYYVSYDIHGVVRKHIAGVFIWGKNERNQLFGALLN